MRRQISVSFLMPSCPTIWRCEFAYEPGAIIVGECRLSGQGFGHG